MLVWKERPQTHFRTVRGWRVFNSRYANKNAGRLFNAKDGRHFYLIKINQVLYAVHRIIFAIHHGFDPLQKEVDHIDGNATNNNPSNLRICTRQENSCNKGLAVNNKSGHTGVTWCKRTQKWMAQIGFDKKAIFLGRFNKIEDAVQKRKKAALSLHGEFAGIKNRPQVKKWHHEATS